MHVEYYLRSVVKYYLHWSSSICKSDWEERKRKRDILQYETLPEYKLGTFTQETKEEILQNVIKWDDEFEKSWDDLQIFVKFFVLCLESCSPIFLTK